ncbi:MAG: M48 family metalloprotease [Gemmatimonadota bacterium]
MTDQEFDALVARLQRQSAAHPVIYRMRVLLLALLGYGYLLGAVVVLGIGITLIVGAAVALRVAFFAGKIVGPLATQMSMVLRALWVRIPTPEGIAVTAAQAPPLFAMLDRLRTQAHGPRIHVVLLGPELNASIVQVPRLGVLGWQRNYLLLGIPLMQLLSPQELEAVVAHEIGHLVGAHGRWGVWLYRQRQSWIRLLQQLEAQQQLANSEFLDFSRWYAPLFNAYTFVMARAHEYEADQLSARVVGSRVAANALVRIETRIRWSAQVYWEEIRRRVRTEASPPDAVYSDQAHRGRSPHETDRTFLAQSLEAETGHLDTHPSLRARLAALGEEPALPPPFERSSAQEFLGQALAELEGRINRSWYDWAVDDWRRTHGIAVRQRERLAALAAQEATAPLSVEQLWERACLLSHEERFDESFALVESLVAAAPSFAPALSTWGRILLSRGDEAGLQHIDRALELGIDPVEPCSVATTFLQSRGRGAEAARYTGRMREYEQAMAPARAERQTFRPNDATDPHGLDEGQLDAIRAALRKFPRVASAALLRKRLRHFPETPLYVLGVRIRRQGWARVSTQATSVMHALVAGLRLPGDWICFPLDLLTRIGAKRFEEAAGGAFYRAETPPQPSPYLRGYSHSEDA